MACPPRDSTRRRALRAIGGVGVAALSGCLSPTSRSDRCPGSDEGTLDLDDATATGVSNEFSSPLDALPHATRVTVADALETEPGEATARGYYRPDPRSEFVVTGPEPRYYRLETTDHDRVRTTGYEYAVEIDADYPVFFDREAVRSFAELPAHDRESLRGAIGNAGLIHAPHYTSFSVVFAYEEVGARDRSAFIPGTDTRYLEWDGVPLRLTFEERRTVAIASTTVAAELVATSPSEFREYVGERRGVVLDSLPTDQREIVERAIDGTYAECEPYSEPFSDLRKRLSTGGDEAAPLVRYGGDWYFGHLG
ncbi:hypothetical protein [Halorubrum sp. Boch-26]|uniref:hypothetical protein n=1 Tax=Halorubrum sp. Boch-26 TaxID=2994426 RepID=UPI002468F335|nr:hypothetical protein [Halorubrum sp. Boch-26]